MWWMALSLSFPPLVQTMSDKKQRYINLYNYWLYISALSLCVCVCNLSDNFPSFGSSWLQAIGFLQTVKKASEKNETAVNVSIEYHIFLIKKGQSLLDYCVSFTVARAPISGEKGATHTTNGAVCIQPTSNCVCVFFFWFFLPREKKNVQVAAVKFGYADENKKRGKKKNRSSFNFFLGGCNQFSFFVTLNLDSTFFFNY